MDRPVRPTAVARLLRLMHESGPMNRATATTRLGLTRTAVGEAAAWLTERGVLSTEQGPPAGRGRPSPLLALAPRGPVVIAAHLRPRRVDIAVVGLGARVVSRTSHRVGAAPQAALTDVATHIAAAVDATGRPCVGVAVGLAGMTRPGGVVRNAVHFGWDRVPAEQILREHLPPDLPVRLENDSGLTALAEYRRGAGRHPGTVLVLACEHTGIGGALITDGTTHHVLEAGHLSIDPHGLDCPCGQRGCLEMYADARAVLREAAATDLADVFARAELGDPRARYAVDTAADHLGSGLASLVNIVVPARVVLAGVLGDLHRLAAQRVHAHLARSVVARTDDTEVVAGAAADSVLVGAAELAFDPYLAHPRTPGGTP
ncbi:ROK family transcriptional regulator [Actinokineospora enzanensis]|uniref:ROK family transcriptional regulator n=1 Tax=Actinokineospora enzanensis TaxID=155975 RepID=UPI0012EB4446|nr:ROK family transcriptional regulator [Actinokineospora enzanensis]